MTTGGESVVVAAHSTNAHRSTNETSEGEMNTSIHSAIRDSVQLAGFATRMTLATLVLLSGMWLQSSKADECPGPRDGACARVGDALDLSGAPPATSIEDANTHFDARLRVAIKRNACLPLYHHLDTDPLGRCDFGTDYHVSLLARLAYQRYFPGDPAGGPLRQEAIDSLRALYTFWLGARSDWHVGTDTPLHEEVTLPLFGTIDLAELFVEGGRNGDYDILMNALMTVAYKYGPRGKGAERNVLPPDVYDQILTMMD